MKQITKEQKFFDFLTALDLFQNLSQAEIKKILAASEIKLYQKNESVFHEGENAQYLYMVQSGMVKIFKLSYDGKEHILNTMTSGQIFAEVPMFGEGTYPANCAALEQSILIRLSRQHLLLLITKEPKIALNMLAIQAHRLRELTEQIEGLALQNALARLRAYLLKNAGQDGVLNKKLSITTLAKVLGMTRENLSKTLHRLKEDGIISIKKNIVIINDQKRLTMQGR